MKSKKRKPNKKLFIAIGMALVLGLVLVVLLKDYQNRVDEVKIISVKIQDDKDKIQTKLNDVEGKLRIALREKQIETLSKQEQLKKNTSSIVVTSHTIESGKRLDRSDLEIREWSPDLVPVNATDNLETLLGRITSDTLVKGEVILPDKLIDKDVKILSVPDGYRAMTLPITSLTGVGGHIIPGARVDLVTLVPGSLEAGTNEMMSKIILQNVKVLASSGKVDDLLGHSKKIKSDATITVAVPAESVAKVALAYNNGKGNIQAVLRGFQDGSRIDKTDIATAELITGQMQIEEEAINIPDVDLPPPPSDGVYSQGSNVNLNSILSDVDGLPPPEPPTARTKTHSIEIIQANTRQEVSFETEI